MNRLDYLKFALNLKLYKKLDWLISAFSIISESSDKWKENPYEGRIVQEQFGTFYVNAEKELVKIGDLKPLTAPFAMLEDITVDALGSPLPKNQHPL